MDLADDTFDLPEGYALVDFWAPWCGPCRQLEPILVDVAEELQIPLHKLLVDDNPLSAQRYGVQGIPTVIVFHDGQEAGRIVGSQPRAALLQEIQKITNGSTSS